jgi:dipeptidyl aminopeptidase/acylaminoacyl peptidase
VIIHGYGNSTRANPWTRAHAESLAQRGIAVLHPDKRGSGASGGNWIQAGFLELADDAIAAVNVLRKNPKVDPVFVGVIGFSQGGHIAPAAASRSKDVAYAISVSGSVVPLVEQIEDELTLAAEREGLSGESIALIRRIHGLAAGYAQDKTTWDEYSRELEQAKKEPLAGNKLIEGFPSVADAPQWTFARAVGQYDPLPYWREVKVPALFVYGGKDTNVRVGKSITRIQHELDPLDLNYVLVVFGENGHSLHRADELDFLASWIKGKGKS